MGHLTAALRCRRSVKRAITHDGPSPLSCIDYKNRWSLSREAKGISRRPHRAAKTIRTSGGGDAMQQTPLLPLRTQSMRLSDHDAPPHTCRNNPSTTSEDRFRCRAAGPRLARAPLLKRASSWTSYRAVRVADRHRSVQPDRWGP